MKRTLITSALPYVNNYLHLGHIAGAYLPADMYARFLRLTDERVLYICGSDEHGAAISIAAEKENTTPQVIIDKYHAANYDAFCKLGMSFDHYSRTSTTEHRNTAQEFFLDFHRNGYLIEKEEEQLYDAKAQMFLPDRYVEGTCPNCGFDKARGDQCDNCGAYYNQTELLHPRSTVSEDTPVVKKTKHWFFPLGKFQQRLEQYVASHSNEWKDNILQQTQSWLKQGLTDRSVTRDLNWGVPVPLPDAEGKVIYVWFEAVLGYISATKEWASLQNQPEAWKEWWQDKDTEYIAFIGKDNIVFHTLIFPVLLMAKNGYILPHNVPGNEFLNLEGEKFSKSRNWGIELREYLHDFPEERDVDALRYVLAMNMPETKDADFTWKDFQARVNNELVGSLGNFVNRALQFLHKNFSGRIPQLPEKYSTVADAWNSALALLQSEADLPHKELTDRVHQSFPGVLDGNDLRLISALFHGAETVANCYRNFRFRETVVETMNISRAANKYFNDSAPWKSLKQAPDECAKSLFIAAQAVRSLAVAFSPIIPFGSRKMLALMGADQLQNDWARIPQPLIPENTSLGVPEILFAKMEDDIVQREIEKLKAKSKTPSAPAIPLPPQIAIDDFQKIALRTGVVIAAERIKKSKKLLKLSVDIGVEKRQIVAGIAQAYPPEELLGKTVVIVANLKPAKLMGIESQGMLLAANAPNGELVIVSPQGDMEPGAEVR